VCGAAVLVALVGLLARDAPASAASGGMVRYDHPVFHNGKRVLWHGAWRGSAGRHGYAHTTPANAPAPETVAATSAAAAGATAAAAPSAALKPFAIVADPGDLVASRMAREFVEVLTAQGAQGRAIVGSTAPTGVAKVMRSDMADFAIVTIDSLAVSVKYQPDWPKKVPLVARLASEIIEVVASKEVKSINDLAGKSVSFGDPDGTTGISAKLLFSRLGVNVDPIYEPLADAVAAMNAGKRDAVVVLGGKEAHAFDGFGDDHRYHLVAIPWSAPLEQVYAPARVEAADRPNLVAANDAVETVAAPMALVALDAPAGSARADAAGRVARAFFDNYESVLTPAHDEHWRDVNLAAGASVANADWPRLAAAQGWIEDHKTTADSSLDAFRASARAAEASGGPKPDDSDRLYDGLTRWRSLLQ
jgi:TRAP-type uncharacterized transport system substrate-binding protein